MRGAILLLLFLSTGTCKVLISVSIKSKGDSLDPAALSAGGYGLQNVTETEVLSVEPLVAAEAWVNLTGSRAALDPSAVSGLPAALPPLLPDGASLQPVLTLDRVAVRECARGTFSPDFGGECRNCTAACEAESYVRSACTSSRDLVCMECAVCGPTDLELCPCGPVSDACFIGNRVCLRVAPTDVTLKIGLAAVTFLTEEQLAQVQASLNTTFAEWLGAAFGCPVSMSDYSAVRIETTYLFVQFLAAGLYNRTTIARLRQVDQAFMQEGVLTTLGQGARRRRLLQAFLTVKQTSAACEVQTIECPAFTEFTVANCSGTCQPTPCPVGYTGGLGQCEPCATSGYKDTNGSAACTPCPTNSLTQAQAATSRGQCLCLAGFYNDTARGGCARCQVANFCPGGGGQVRCPLQKFAPAGAASADQCACPTRASVPEGGSACACPDSGSLRVELSPPDTQTGATFRCDLCPPGGTCALGVFTPFTTASPPTTKAAIPPTTTTIALPTTTATARPPRTTTDASTTTTPAATPAPTPVALVLHHAYHDMERLAAVTALSLSGATSLAALAVAAYVCTRRRPPKKKPKPKQPAVGKKVLAFKI